MSLCPKCNSTNADDAILCSQCGANLTASDDASQTINLDLSPLSGEEANRQTLDAADSNPSHDLLFESDEIRVEELTTRTVSSSDSHILSGEDDASRTIDQQGPLMGSVQANRQTLDPADSNPSHDLMFETDEMMEQDPSKSTINASDSHILSGEDKDETAQGSKIISKTVDASDVALVTDEANRRTLAPEDSNPSHDLVFETDDLKIDQTLDISAGQIVTDRGTVVAPQDASSQIDQTIDATDGQSFLAEIRGVDDKVEAIDGTYAVELTDPNVNQTIEITSRTVPEGTDNEATILFGTTSPVTQPNDQTVVFGSEGTDQGTVAVDDSGTEGRLKRMWEGAVGSSANPMHSLSAMSMQASDSIFERVATRKVLDANAPPSADADYKIVDKLGEGAMGIVFTARQTAVDRLVALKTAKPNFQKNEEARRRFLYEAQITADLDHSNIVPIHELGVSEDGMLFYSMKIVEGDQWSRVISERTREQNIDIFMKVADAVAFAHSKGIIHRDLKPENTMLGRFGEVFVTDWGTAINLNRDSSPIVEVANKGERRLLVDNAEYFRAGESIVITNDEEVFERNEIGAVKGNELMLRKKLSREYRPAPTLRAVKAFNMAGTPCYMAPEMAGHHLNRLGRTSDIYVLGAILFDMVTGRPPHTGPTVTHCLKNALENDLIVPDNAEEDALLKIALKAMASEPKDRYASVEQMQDAVRQYRRHAESISLAERSADLLEHAKATGDYETYSRAMFGFRDAIELWPENTIAANGLLSARREYGETAFGKGDFDLVLQTVDRNFPEENELYTKAQQAKQKRLERESRIKKLQRLVAAVVLFAVVGLSGLLLYALNEQRKAIAAAKAENIAKLDAEEKRQQAVVAQELAVKEKEAADKARETAEMERMKADLARQTAEKERMAADLARMEETEAKIQAEKDREAAEKAKIFAEEQQRKAVLAQKAEAEAKVQIQLDEYKSSIALAGSRLASFDVQDARRILERLKSAPTSISNSAPPAFDTWGWQRINLLGNADLPQVSVPGDAAATAAAANANVVAVATKEGKIQVFDVTEGLMKPVVEHVEPDATDFALALSPDGSQLAFSYVTNDGNGLKFWNLSGGKPEMIKSAGKRNFQRLAFSADGQNLIAGISAGLWIWNIKSSGWLSNESPTTRLDNVRGELVQIQQLSDSKYLLTTDFENSRSLRIVGVSDSSNDELKLPSSFAGLLSCAKLLSDNEIALGLTDNRVAIASVSENSIVNEVVLEDKHAAAVTDFSVDKSGRLISMSDAEPVAQVWQKSDGQWQYESYLSGLSSNLASVMGTANGLVIGVDDKANSLAWDIKRQVQRSRMERTSATGDKESYSAPVQHVVLGDFNDSALAIDAKGVVDLWSLKDGKTIRYDDQRFTYLGHTPGAELIDSAIDRNAQVLVTVGRLRDADKNYLVDRNATWEFCLWDLSSKQMVRRWTRTDAPAPGQEEAASVEPRLTLVDRGSKLLLGSDTQTQLIDLATGREIFKQTNFGTYFAVANPSRPSQLLLVKRSGAIRLLDLDNLNAWEDTKLNDSQLRTATDTPMHAVWSGAGNRFYLVFASGNVARVKIVDRDIDIEWHSAELDEVSNRSWKDALKLLGGRIRLHNDLDVMLERTGDGEVLHYAVRSGNESRLTKHVAIRFADDRNQPKSVEQVGEPANGNQWLNRNTDGKVALADQFHDQLTVDTSRVRVVHQLDQEFFVSSRTAQTYGISKGSTFVSSFARVPPRSATGDLLGRTMLVLQSDGAVLKYSIDDENRVQAKTLDYTLPAASRIQLSGNGKSLAVLTEGSLSIHDAESGESVKTIGPATAFAWSPGDQFELAVCDETGKISIYDASYNVTKEFSQALGENENVVSLHYLRETFAAEDVPARRHLLVQTRSSVNDIVTIHSIDTRPQVLLDETGQSEQPNEIMKVAIDLNSLVSVSPVEGIFATGLENGTVNIWYCNPTWGEPRQLFDLAGHRGAKITSMQFTNDGKTLVTADDNSRLYAWISKDPLNGE